MQRKMYRIKSINDHAHAVALKEFFELRGSEEAEWNVKCCFNDGEVDLLSKDNYEELSKIPGITLEFLPKEHWDWAIAKAKELVREIKDNFNLTPWEDIIRIETAKQKAYRVFESKGWDTGKPRDFTKSLNI
jgi:hypothetical protein